MRREMSQNRKVTLFLLIANALVYLILFFMNWTGGDTGEEEIYVADTILEDVAELTLTYQKETVNFISENGTWVIEDDSTYATDQDLLEEITDQAHGMKSSRILENAGEQFALYGLDDPVCVVSAADSMGNRVTYVIGLYNENAFCYYVTTTDSDSVWLVGRDEVEKFFVTKLDVAASFDYSGFTASQASSVTITYGDEECAVKLYDAASGDLYSDHFKWKLEGVYDFTVPASKSRVSDLIYYFKDLSPKRVAYGIDKGKMESWGLSQPSIVFAMTYKMSDQEVGFTFLIGKESQEGGAYAMFAGDKLIYQLDADDLLELYKFCDKYHFINGKICDIDLDTVNSIEIATGSDRYKIDIQRINGTASYYVDGEEAGPEEFHVFYNNLTQLGYESLARDIMRENDASIKVRFIRSTDHHSDVTLTLTPYDSSFYLAEFCGIDNYLVSKKDVADILNSLMKMI